LLRELGIFFGEDDDCVTDLKVFGRVFQGVAVQKHQLGDAVQLMPLRLRAPRRGLIPIRLDCHCLSPSISIVMKLSMTQLGETRRLPAAPLQRPARRRGCPDGYGPASFDSEAGGDSARSLSSSSRKRL